MMWKELIIAFLLCQAQGLVTAQSSDSDLTTLPPAPTNGTTPTPAPTTTTKIPDTTTTTTTSTTTPKTTTTSTTPPSTTTTQSTTTTVKPTDKTTTVGPTPTPKPGPVPTSMVWNVTDEVSGVACVLVSAKFQAQVIVKDEADNKTSTVKVDVPLTAEATGKCDSGLLGLEYMNLTWTSPGMSNQSFLTLLFKKNESAGAGKEIYNIESIISTFYYVFNNKTLEASLTVDEPMGHSVSENKSFTCVSQQVFGEKTVPGVNLSVENFKFQAFRHSNDTKFATAEVCAADGYVTDIVPIAVGASLAGLVVIVLIAYLFGRRRSRARGYQSV